MSFELLFEHTISLAAIIIVVMTAVGFGLFTFLHYLPKSRTTTMLMVLRLLFIILFMWCLLMPVLKHALMELLKPRFLVALDTSISMTLTPTNDIPSRWDVALEVLNQPWTRKLAAQCLVDCYPFDHELGNKSKLNEIPNIAPEGHKTYLRTNLKKLLDRYKGQNVCGLLLLSDGLDTREANDSWVFGDWPYPVYTVRPEPPDIWKVEPDVRVDSVDTPRRAVMGWDTELKVSVSGQGTRGQAIEVQLYQNEQILESIPIEIPDKGGSRSTTLRLTHPEKGDFTYTVTIPPIKGETRTNDNLFSITVQVIDSKNRLLYVEGVPRWESKYMVRALKGNKEITPICFIRGPGGRFLSYGTQSTISPEMNKQQLRNFKIVMLGDLAADELGKERAESLVDFVENGGSLVLLGGAKAWGDNGYANTPLRKILPVQKQGRLSIQEGEFDVMLTPDGQLHPAFHADDKTVWKNIPSVLSFFPAGTLSPAASVLLTTVEQGNQPIIVVQPYGQGKVLTVLTDSMWQWQLSPGKKNLYQRFWNQMLLWLSPAEAEMATFKLDLFADAERFFLGDAIDLRARLEARHDTARENISLTCEIQCPDKRKIPFTMAKQNITTSTGKTYPGFSVSFTPQNHGLHTAVAFAEINGQKVESPPYSFFIQPFTPESDPRPASINVLASLAKSSRGQFCELDEVSDVLSDINVKTSEEERLQYQSLWNNIPIIACLLGLLTVEWTLRKAKNMA